MDVKQIFQTIKKYLSIFWRWIKPYLLQFHQWRKRIWKKYHVNKVIILLGLSAILVTSVYLYSLAKSTNVAELETGLREATIFLDQDGEEAGRINQKGTFVELDEISSNVIDALISAEDRRFFEHRGFDIRGILRAAGRMIVRGDVSGGGGSTITQQLAKNAYLTLDQTFTRKAKEIFLAIEIEKHYTKEEILLMYLNTSYFGNGVWGIEDASQRYFGTSAANLTVGQAATLVGTLNGPSIFNPLDQPENATNRRATVLSMMVDNDMLDQATADQENQIEMTSMLNNTLDQTSSGYNFPFYFDAVLSEIENVYGLNIDDVMNRGYRIYTALDQEAQRSMQAAFDRDELFPPNAEDGTMVQAASVALNPQTGGVTALVGRRGEHTFRGFNFATDMRRSPGSTLKPISAFVPGLEAGFKPDSILKDEPLDFYEARNYSGTYQGEAPMYEAIANSLNLPAVWMLNQVGIDAGFAKTEEFGIELTENDHYYGLALGGLEFGASPLTMAAAYAVFANGGTLYTPYLVTKIVDSTGAVIVDNTNPRGKRIISEETADQMTSMLLGVYSNGTAAGLAPAGYTMAGKTGTTETNFDIDKTNDQWIIGYTPDVVIATWLGFEITSPDHFLTGTSGQTAGRVFTAQAEGILPTTAGTQFTIADAYATGGQMMAAEDVPAESTNDNAWREDLDEFADRARNGMERVGEYFIEGAREILRGIRGLIP